MAKYKRIIIKFSGEALPNSKDSTILDREKVAKAALVIKKIRDQGVEVGVVVGAGNIWRGRLAATIGIEQSTADYMGMLGTIINALAIQSAVQERGVDCRVMSAIAVNQVCEPYIRLKAISHLRKGIVPIFAGGTGNPYFTTDTNAALRAMEVGADAIIMAKNGVDGVYDSDPRTNPNAKLNKNLTFQELIQRRLGVMDLNAAVMLEGKGIEIRVFSMDDPNNFDRLLAGEEIGTKVAD